MKRIINNLKAQTWSIDIVIGVVLFLVIIVVVYTLIASSSMREIELMRDVDNIYSKLDGSKGTHIGVPSFFSGNVITQEGIDELLAQEYENLKVALGIRGDFCIVITYAHGGIHDLNENKRSYGDSSHGVEISSGIYCGD